MTRHLFIVARNQPQLYDYLNREFSEETEVQVVVDRRQGERRQDGSSYWRERRRLDRRTTPHIDTQIRSLGYAMVRTG